MAQLPQRLRLDLADPLAGDVELLADLLMGSKPDFFDLFVDGCRFAPLPATGRPPLLWSVVGPQSRSEFNYLRIWVSRLRRKLGVPVGSSGPIRAFQGIGYLLDSHWTPEIEGGLGEEPDPVTGATTEPGAETDPEPVEVGRPED